MPNLSNLFRLNNQPIELSPSQQQIFDLILFKQAKRSQVIAPTQYGKSLTVALATLLRTVATDERFIILAPSEKKAQIIMGYIIDHAFDSEMITEQLELDASVSLDRLRRERSRNHLTFKGGGGIKTLTLDAKNGKKSIEAAMGFGGNRLILDESSLIDDVLYATVKRMLGGYAYDDTFLLEIGNPFYRNHFHRTWHDDLYHKVFIDYHTGLAEGRYSPEFIAEMRKEALFDVFYECKFPDEEAIDDKGFRPLITSEAIEDSYTDTFINEGDLTLGVDVAGGGDENVYVLRSPKTAMIAARNHSNDTMVNVVEVQRLLDEYPNLRPECVFIDDIGIGRGVTDRLKELGLEVNGVSVGEPAEDKTRYANIKAENYWNAANWIRDGGKLVRGDGWMQLSWIKYKVTSDKVIQIEPKLELKKRTGKSPDVAEALMLSHGAPGEAAFVVLG